MIEVSQLFVGGWWQVKIDGQYIKDKNENNRNFKTEEAAIKAAKKLKNNLK